MRPWLALLVLFGCERIRYDHLVAESPPRGLTYERSGYAYLVDQPAPVLRPWVHGVALQFTVEPALPPGLRLDRETGELSGTPIELSGPAGHVVSATNRLGSTTTTLSLQVVDGFVVDSTLDEPATAPVNDRACKSEPSGVCTLRAAIEEANAWGGEQAILMPAGHYLLTSVLPVHSSLFLLGEPSHSTVLDGNDATVLIQVAGSETTVGLADLVLTGGYGHRGGALSTDDDTTTTVSHCRFESNVSTSTDPNFGGGAIFQGEFNGSDLVVEYSTFTGNTAESGAAIRKLGGASLTLERSLFSNNSGGATVFAGHGPLVIRGSTFSGNHGGGGVIDGLATDAEVTNSTFVANTTSKGAIALENEGTVSVSHCLFAQNNGTSRAGAISLGNGESAMIANSVFASNIGGEHSTCAAYRVPSFTSLGGNLSDSTGQCGLSASAGDLEDIDARVSTLELDDYPVPLLPLQANSPAIDAATADECLETDQRGFPRPVDGDGDGVAACDAGPIEVDP